MKITHTIRAYAHRFNVTPDLSGKAVEFVRFQHINYVSPELGARIEAASGDLHSLHRVLAQTKGANFDAAKVSASLDDVVGWDLTNLGAEKLSGKDVRGIRVLPVLRIIGKP